MLHSEKCNTLVRILCLYTNRKVLGVCYDVCTESYGWLGSRVVSVLDSGAEVRVQIAAATLPGNSLRLLGKLLIPIVPLFIKQQNW